eukprot:jgi/Botrbrau1/22899/Bobra.0065s0052.2
MKKERSTFGVPLYGAVWPPGDFVIFGGGGGKASSGILNKLSVARIIKGVLSEELALLKFENDTPLRLALTSSGDMVLVGMAAGGIGLVRIALDSQKPAPVLTLNHNGVAAGRLMSVGMVKAMAFSLDGRFLAVGLEDGGLEVRDWPSARPLLSLEGETALREAARDVDFSPAHSNQVLAVTCEDGSCSLWEWERGVCITRLELPPDIKRGSFSRARWARDGSLGIYTAVTTAGEGHVMYYEQDDTGEMICRKKARVDPNPITALDISPSGELLGFGTSEGDVAVLSVSNLKAVSRQKGAHLVFVTAVTFSPQSNALLSVSGDASARVTLAKASSSDMRVWLLLAIVLAIVAVLVQLLLHMDLGTLTSDEL